MSNPEVQRSIDVDTRSARAFDMRIEVVVIPVSDVDSAKRFYSQLGWRLDLDFKAEDGYRVVQFTPPGSACSVILGNNLTEARPGSAHDHYLVVSDIEAVRHELLGRAIQVGKPFHDAGAFSIMPMAKIKSAAPIRTVQAMPPTRVLAIQTAIDGSSKK